MNMNEMGSPMIFSANEPIYVTFCAGKKRYMSERGSTHSPPFNPDSSQACLFTAASKQR